MPWIYHQKGGKLYHDDKYVGRGWSGHGAGRNAPSLQNLSGMGPLPRGSYSGIILLSAFRHRIGAGSDHVLEVVERRKRLH